MGSSVISVILFVGNIVSCNHILYCKYPHNWRSRTIEAIIAVNLVTDVFSICIGWVEANKSESIIYSFFTIRTGCCEL